MNWLRIVFGYELATNWLRIGYELSGYELAICGNNVSNNSLFCACMFSDMR